MRVGSFHIIEAQNGIQYIIHITYMDRVYVYYNVLAFCSDNTSNETVMELRILNKGFHITQCIMGIENHGCLIFKDIELSDLPLYMSWNLTMYFDDVFNGRTDWVPYKGYE